MRQAAPSGAALVYALLAKRNPQTGLARRRILATFPPVGYGVALGAARAKRGLALVLKIIHPLGGCVAIALLVGTGAAPAADDFALTGSYTQNVPCKGDGSDPSELKVNISPEEIDSHIGVCTFLGTKRDGRKITAHVECRFPSGPLMGDVIFTMRPDNTVEFIDRDKTYSAVLYRCPN